MARPFVRSGALAIGTITDADLPAPNALLDRCEDRPVDFAEATLVHLAEREGPTTTTSRRTGSAVGSDSGSSPGAGADPGPVPRLLRPSDSHRCAPSGRRGALW